MAVGGAGHVEKRGSNIGGRGYRYEEVKVWGGGMRGEEGVEL